MEKLLKIGVLWVVIVASVFNLGMAKLAPHYVEGTGPRYFLHLLKKEALIYKRSYLNYPSSIEKLEEDMRRRYAGNIDFFYKVKGHFHSYQITESSPNFFRARSFNEKGYPNYEITSIDANPILIVEENTMTGSG